MGILHEVLHNIIDHTQWHHEADKELAHAAVTADQVASEQPADAPKGLPPATDDKEA
jgi:hypothetical protein